MIAPSPSYKCYIVARLDFAFLRRNIYVLYACVGPTEYTIFFKLSPQLCMRLFLRFLQDTPMPLIFKNKLRLCFRFHQT
jgi:hypothetical protein